MIYLRPNILASRSIRGDNVVTICSHPLPCHFLLRWLGFYRVVLYLETGQKEKVLVWNTEYLKWFWQFAIFYATFSRGKNE